MWKLIMLGWLLGLFGCEKQRDADFDSVSLDRDKDMKLFYPVLRNYDSDDLYAGTVVHRRVADRLAVFACRRIPLPQGRIRVDYVMKAKLDSYNMSEEEILDACYENFFAANIKVDVSEQDDSRLFQFSSSHDFVAAILGHESTYPKFAEMTGSADIAVLIMSPDIICITAVGSNFEPGFADIADEPGRAGRARRLYLVRSSIGGHGPPYRILGVNQMELREQSQVCEDLAIRWLDEAVVLLNSLLIEHGVSGRDEREAILGKFFFHLSVQLDGASDGIEFEGRGYGPILAFMEEGHKPPRLHVSDSYDLHDYAHSQVFNVLEGEKA